MNMKTSAELDLAGTIRPGLDILANEIVIALKKRTRFLQNAAVYSSGLIATNPDISLLQYELHAAECNHAELGRYQFAVQEAFTDIGDIKTVILRDSPQSDVMSVPSGAGDRILVFYKDWISQACDSGSDDKTYGETVTSDVAALLAIMERVNLGKTVAESKFRDLTGEFMETKGEREAMLSLIVRPDRMEQVMELARKLASHYDISAKHIESVFDFMMNLTIDIEVDYLRKRIELA